VQGPRAIFTYFDLLFGNLCELQANFVKKKLFTSQHFTFKILNTFLELSLKIG
jgi:hypothetical protein